MISFEIFTELEMRQMQTCYKHFMLLILMENMSITMIYDFFNHNDWRIRAGSYLKFVSNLSKG